LDSSPGAFLEVKGEWSLSRLVTLLTSQSKIDPILATEKYRLVKEFCNSEELFYGNKRKKRSFMGYNSQVKNISKDSPEVSMIQSEMFNIISKIAKNKRSVYPNYIGYKYGKKKSVKTVKPTELSIVSKLTFNHSVEVNILYQSNYLIFRWIEIK
jgi:hypothetical protein